jgi:tellurite resistance protein TehA-like permease
MYSLLGLAAIVIIFAALIGWDATRAVQFVPPPLNICCGFVIGLVSSRVAASAHVSSGLVLIAMLALYIVVLITTFRLIKYRKF